MTGTPTINKKPLFDLEAVVESVQMLIGSGQVTELRALEATTAKERWPHTASGYFDDVEKLAAELPVFLTAKGIYIIPNPIESALLARAANRIRKAQKGDSTQDSNILRRQWLLVDTDPQRPSGISSTESEHEAALNRARSICELLREEGWPDPIVADSGNGAHLIYRIDVTTDDGGLIARCLKAMAVRFDDSTVKVDQSVFNPARIWKLYGTLACKGDDTPERPHRMARILSRPDDMQVVDGELLEALAAEAPTDSPAPRTHRRNNGPSSFDLEAFIAHNRLNTTGPEDWSGQQGVGKRWLLNQSPLCDHGGDGPFIIQHASGAISAGCQHNSCNWDWSDLRNKFEPRINGRTSSSIAISNSLYDSDLVTAPSIATIDGQTDNANARRMAIQIRGRAHWVPEWSKWITWTGSHWKIDGGTRIQSMAKDVVKSFWKDVSEVDSRAKEELDGAVRWAKQSNNVPRIEGMIKLCRSEPGVTVPVKELDSHPDFFNCANGTLNLETGELLPHDPTHLITQIAGTAYDKSVQPRRWLKFLDEIFDNDSDLVLYVQRIFGLSISGRNNEHILPICFGTGANGKSVLLNTILKIAGTYGTLASQDLLAPARDNRQHEVADLFGKRYVPTMELESGRFLAEATVKSLTGDEYLKGRRLYENAWVFCRTHTHFIACNHKPRVRGQDNGIWRRLRLIPFNVTIPPNNQDPDLAKKLEPEFPGIAHWLLRGFQDYLNGGLRDPDRVLQATSQYRDSMDSIGQFVSDCCVEDLESETPTSELHDSYQSWSPGAGAMSRQAFSEALADRYEKFKATSGRNRNKQCIRGLRLPSERS